MTDAPPPNEPPPPGWSAPPPPPPPPPGYGYTPGPATPLDPLGRPLAEWWKRLVAWIIDSIVVGIPTGILTVAVAIGDDAFGTPPGFGLPFSGPGFFSRVSIGLVIGLAYFGLLNGSERGQTLGKMAFNITVRDAATGGPIGYGRGLLRYGVMWALGAFTCNLGLLLDGLWPLWDERRQALHDKVATSVVVQL